MYALSILIGMDALLLKYGMLTWLDAIQTSGVLATFAALIEVAFKLIFGK